MGLQEVLLINSEAGTRLAALDRARDYRSGCTQAALSLRSLHLAAVDGVNDTETQKAAAEEARALLLGSSRTVAAAHAKNYLSPPGGHAASYFQAYGLEEVAMMPGSGASRRTTVNFLEMVVDFAAAAAAASSVSATELREGSFVALGMGVEKRAVAYV